MNLERARAYAQEMLELERDGYDRRLHDKKAQHIFRESRQADLFAAVNAAASAERELDREIERKERLSRLARTLEGCLADGCTVLRVVVTTRKGQEKEARFSNAWKAATFARAVQDARLEWRVERQPQARAQDRDAARLVFEHRLSRAAGVKALQYLLGRGMKYESVLAMSMKAHRALEALVDAEKAKRWRALERRWREVSDSRSRVAEALGKGDTLERVLGGLGVRPETYADDSMQTAARRAALQAASTRERRLLETFELQDLFCTLPLGEDRPLPARLVVVDTAADVLAYRQIRGHVDGTAYVAIGFGPLEDATAIRGDGLATNGRKFEQLMLGERWRAWEAGQEAPAVVFALGTGAHTRQREKILRKLVPNRMEVERDAPQHAPSWSEELVKRERDYIRSLEARSPTKGAARLLGMAP